MVLGHGRVVGGQLAARGGEPQGEAARGLGGGGSLLCLALPAADDVLGNRKEVVGRYEGGGRDGGVLVDDCGLHHSLNGLDGGRLELVSACHPWYRGARSSAYIDDAAKGADGIGAVDGIGAASSVFHDGAGDHDDVLGGGREFLRSR